VSSSTTIQASGSVIAGEHQLRVDGSLTRLYAAAVHYWRLERDRWAEVLDAVRSLNFTAISIYIPWEAHEISRGEFDFGHIDPRTDIDAFLTMCEQRGFDIVVRPGPQINAEMPCFGYPRRILEDEELHARSAQGSRYVLTQVPKPIPALSYATEKFFAETALWFDAICPILAAHAHPRGRLLAAQVDNEMAYFFGINAYSADFHPDSIAAYRRFLRDKYGDLGALAETYGRELTAFDEVEPPRRFTGTRRHDIPYYADWAEYRERYLLDSIGRLAVMMRERGLDRIALFHNYPHPLSPGTSASGFTAPFNLVALEEKLDFVGFDIYSRKQRYDHVQTVASYVAGSSRYPYAPELVAGAWAWYLDPGDVTDEDFVAKAALMNGYQGFSRYMLVERDRWFASPVRRDGRVRQEKAQVFSQLNAMAQRHRLAELRRTADVLLLADRDYDRLEAASVLVSFPGDFLETPSGFSEYPNPMTVSEELLGFQEPVQVAKRAWFECCYRGLTESGHDFLLSDTALPAARWRPYRALVLGTFEYLNAGVQRAVLDFAQHGGLVVLGPRLPHLDERMRPDETLRAALDSAARSPLTVNDTEIGGVHHLGRGRVVHLENLDDPAAALDTALAHVDARRVRSDDPRLDTTVHHAVDGSGRMVVFVANPSAKKISAQIDVGVECKSVTEIWDDRPMHVKGGAWHDDLAPYTIGIYECHPVR